MRIVVAGAAGGVGREAVRLSTHRGDMVIGVSRATGDVRDPDLWAPLLPGVDAMLWCVGVTKNSGGDVGRASLPPLLEAMAAHGVRRFVGVSGAGVTLPEDRKGLGARVVSALTLRLARDLVEDKAGEHAVLAASQGVDWTQVRPPRLVDKPGSGRYKLTDVAPGPTAAPVPKADVALAMLDLAGGGEHLGEAPFLVAAT